MAPVFVATVAAFAQVACNDPQGMLVLWSATTATSFKLPAEPINAAFQVRMRTWYGARADYR